MKTFSLILHAFRDLAVRVFPQRHADNKSGYAFIVHPRDINDVYRKYPFAKFLPASAILFILRHFWPVVVSEITGLTSKQGKKIRGWVITIPLTAHQMIEKRSLAVKKIIQAAKLAEHLGAGLIGLGAMTASLTKGGLELVGKTRVNITTGHAFTGYTVCGNFFKLAALWQTDKKAVVVAIVGAAGSVGSLSAQIIAREQFRHFLLIDIERKRDLLDQLVTNIKELNPHASVEITHNINALRKADFIIAATSAPEAIIRADDLKPGAVIIDDAQPSDISSDVYERNDILVIAGGLVHTPDIRTHFNFGLSDPCDNFCCLAEVLILASQEWNEHFVLGRGADLKLVDFVADLAKTINFRLAEFQNVRGKISLTDIRRVREIAQTNQTHI